LTVDGTSPFPENTNMKTQEDPLTFEAADERAVFEHAFRDKPLDPDVRRHVRERAERITEELRRRHGEMSIAVDCAAGLRELLAPDVFHVETLHALTKAERQKRIAAGDGWPLWKAILAYSPAFHPTTRSCRGPTRSRRPPGSASTTACMSRSPNRKNAS
jgi:hypothetical protein